MALSIREEKGDDGSTLEVEKLARVQVRFDRLKTSNEYGDRRVLVEWASEDKT